MSDDNDNNSSSSRGSRPPGGRITRIPPTAHPLEYLSQVFQPLVADERHVHKPNPIMLYLVHWGPDAYLRTVAKGTFAMLETLRVGKGMTPRQEELDAGLELSSRAACWRSWGTPVGVVTGTAYQFYKLRTSASWELFFEPQMAKEEGGRLTWAAFRRGWNNMAGASVSGSSRQQLLVRAFSIIVWTLTMDTVAVVWQNYKSLGVLRSDPRLARFTQSLGIFTDPDSHRADAEKLQTFEQQQRKHMAEEAARRQAESGGDGSPVAEGTDDYYSRYDQSYSSGDEQRATPSTSSWGPRSVGSSTQRNEKSSGGSGADFFGDDDDSASPVAKEYRGPSTTTGGSAWDRVRKTAMQGASNSQSTEWSRAQRESETHSEREIAQADFDRMLEAERHVGSDSGRRSGGSSTW